MPPLARIIGNALWLSALPYGWGGFILDLSIADFSALIFMLGPLAERLYMRGNPPPEEIPDSPPKRRGWKNPLRSSVPRFDSVSRRQSAKMPRFWKRSSKRQGSAARTISIPTSNPSRVHPGRRTSQNSNWRKMRTFLWALLSVSLLAVIATHLYFAVEYPAATDALMQDWAVFFLRVFGN